ncbi:SAVED domain-containing protein [Brassicibacter mesophilus]|uniref:SAVED domain-containing protein n=1 Tax=Brassicibacter mesophilus TaxID=745119 RepID=UPI003D22C3B3
MQDNTKFNYIMKEVKPIIDFILPFVRRSLINRIILTLIGSGITFIGASLFPEWYLPIVIAFLNNKLNLNIDSSIYALNVIGLSIGIILTCIGLILLIVKICDDKSVRNASREKTKNLLKIKHSSIEAVVDFNSMDSDLKNYNVSELELNQANDMIHKNIESALIKQLELTRDIKSFVNSSNFEVVYMGLAHIPLVFLLGYQLSDKFISKFYEWDQNQKIWIGLNNNSNYPKLKLSPNEEIGSSREVGDIIIKIGVTYPIDDIDLEGLNINSIKSFYLKLDKPTRNIVNSSEQLKEYKQVFRNLLDKINQNYPNAKTIHIFYSGQPSLTFTLGATISERMDCDIIVYNHTRNSEIKYSWGLRMIKNSTNKEEIYVNTEGVIEHV